MAGSVRCELVVLLLNSEIPFFLYLLCYTERHIPFSNFTVILGISTSEIRIQRQYEISKFREIIFLLYSNGLKAQFSWGGGFRFVLIELNI